MITVFETSSLFNKYICNQYLAICNIECEDGLYGQNCEYKCGHCSAGSCNRNGHCLQCEVGLLMPFCTGKIPFHCVN